MKFVIRAGGVGSRLWPFSRKSLPKQFHALIGGRTMLQEAVDRIGSIAQPEDLYVSTSSDLVHLVQEQLPEVDPQNIISEPALRNTGPAVGLECTILESRFPGCTVASLGSDHHIGKPEEFCRLLSVAETALEEEKNTLFTIGVKPTRVDTGYGYIKKGVSDHSVDAEPIYKVEQFTEKPDKETAKGYVDSGQYLWNSNMFVWRAKTMLCLFKQFEPEIHALLQTIGAAVGTPDQGEVIRSEYGKMKEIPIDTAILERAQEVATLEANIDWNDIGTWDSLSEVLPTDSRGNLLSGDVVEIDAKDVTAYGPAGRVIALIGVENLVVVDTADAVLVCRKDQAQRVREIVEKLEKKRAELI